MQDAREITFFAGLDLSSVGKTPDGLPLFRVVLAPTRIESLYDSEGVFRQVSVYMHDGWILEKWLPAEAFAGSRESFAQACKSVGLKKRYPSEGEYDAVHPFKTTEEVQLAELYAQMAQYGWQHLSIADRKKIHEWHREKQQKDVAAQRRDMIAEAAPTKFGYAAGLRTGLHAEKFKIYGADGREVVM